MARTCLGDHARYLNVYLKPYPGYYFTGDSVMKDKNGNHFIIGRLDDVSKSILQSLKPLLVRSSFAIVSPRIIFHLSSLVAT